MGVQELTRERQPQGPVTRTEDAADLQALFLLSIALEDTNWLQNDDKRRIYRFVDRATRRIELSRLPTCSWYQLGCQRQRRAVQQRIDVAAKTP